METILSLRADFLADLDNFGEIFNPNMFKLSNGRLNHNGGFIFYKSVIFFKSK